VLTENKQPHARISGQTIIDELIRNMEFGRLEMAYTILLPFDLQRLPAPG